MASRASRWPGKARILPIRPNIARSSIANTSIGKAVAPTAPATKRRRSIAVGGQTRPPDPREPAEIPENPVVENGQPAATESREAGPGAQNLAGRGFKRSETGALQDEATRHPSDASY